MDSIKTKSKSNGYSGPKRAVIYARVSGDDSDKDGRNLAGQLELGREHCAKRGYLVIAELAEDVKGASGAEINLPRLNQIREMAEAKLFDVLAVRELDRLSRSLGKQLIVEEELKRNGVNIEYILYDYPDTPEGALMKNIRASFAEYERAKICERSVRGRRLKVRGGSVLCYGRAPYGYRLDKTEKGYKLTVYPPESEIVRQIFYWWVHERLSLSAIRRRLIEMDAPLYQSPMRGKSEWSTTRLRLLLSNMTYMGVWHFGKRDRKGCWRPRSEWVSVSDPKIVPALVSREDFELAQTLLAANGKRHAVKHHHLMAQRIKCERCGRVMASRPSMQVYNGKTYYNHYYRCDGHGHGRPGHNANGKIIDAAVWGWIKGLLLDPARLREGMTAYVERQEGETGPLRRELEAARELLEKRRREYDKMLDLYLEGRMSKDMIGARVEALNREIDSLQASERELLIQLEAATLTERRIADLEQFAAEIRKRLDYADHDFSKRRWAVETLDVTGLWRVVDGKQVLDVQCIISGEILGLSDIAI